MELRAKLIQMLPLQTGEGKNGQWKKQDIIVETEGQYPKKVCVSIWGDKAEAGVLSLGNMLNISFDVESREFNGRWYTDVRAWKVEMAGASAPMNAADQTAQPVFAPSDENKDDLPF